METIKNVGSLAESNIIYSIKKHGESLFTKDKKTSLAWIITNYNEV